VLSAWHEVNAYNTNAVMITEQEPKRIKPSSSRKKSIFEWLSKKFNIKAPRDVLKPL